MKTADPGKLYSLGQSAGQFVVAHGLTRSIVTLDYGRQSLSGSTWGANDFNGVFHSNSTLAAAGVWYAAGFANGTNSNSNYQLQLGIGTNNEPAGTVTSAAGAAWANMVKSLNSQIGSNGIGGVGGNGADDIEVGWHDHNSSKNWVNGFSGVSGAPLYWDYGDAGGCPQTLRGSSSDACNNGWTVDDVYYMAWGASSAVPMPEIYNTTIINTSKGPSDPNAMQWANISLDGYKNHSGAMNVWGSLTQYKACAQTGGCNGTGNAPTAGWTHLWNALNSDSRIAQTPQYSEDAAWGNA